MNKILVKLTDGKRTYTEDVTEDQKEYYQEISTNGANPEMSKIPFERWIRPLEKTELTDNSLDKYNKRDENDHFIFGWMECFSQSDDVPQWVYDADKLWISVEWE